MDLRLRQKNNNFIETKGSEWGESHVWNWNGLYCHWRSLGDKSNRPIVFIHGFGASSSHWRNNAKYFSSKNFCVYAIDLIGFGESEQPSRKKLTTLDNYFWASQLTAFLEEFVVTDIYPKAILFTSFFII